MLQFEVADWVSFGSLHLFAAFAKTKWPIKTRREEEVIIADGPRERGGGARWKGFWFWCRVQVGTGPMQGHSWLDVELRRVFNLN